MGLTNVQRKVLRCLAPNRRQHSYVAGGAALNRDWPRLSDDIDIFQDTDEETVETAELDIVTLRTAGFAVTVDLEIYGCVEATVSLDGESTLIQWMSETRHRFFPLVEDPDWGFRLNQADLAVNKVLAASTRTKARDYGDLLSIQEYFCDLGPLMLAAAGKPPHFSPQRLIDEIRRRGLSVGNEEYKTVKGLPFGWSPEFIREKLIQHCAAAEEYVQRSPADLVGIMIVDDDGLPALFDSQGQLQNRTATDEHATVPTVGERDEMEWEPPAP